MANRRNSLDQGGRRKRIPVSGNRDVLTASNVPEGYVARWVNDLDNRLAKFQEAGYEFASKDGDITVGDKTVESSNGVDSHISRVVGTDRVTGNPITAYLMLQRQEWYEEDQKEQQKEPDRIEQSLKSEGDKPGAYGDIKLKHSRG